MVVSDAVDTHYEEQKIVADTKKLSNKCKGLHQNAGEHDKFEDYECSCMLYKTGSRRDDHRHLFARLVDRLQ